MNKVFRVYLVALIISSFAQGVLAASKDTMPQRDPDVAWPEASDVDTLALKGWRIVRGVVGFEQDVPRGLAIMEQAASAGSLLALHNLAYVYDIGLYRVPQDKEKAIAYYRKAAIGGFAGSQNNYGWRLYEGNGVKKNITEAVYWITRAVEQGEPFAYGSLASIMIETDVFNQDKIEIYKWLKLAVTFMPKGDTREKENSRLNELKAIMPFEDILEAEKRAENWQPLKQTYSLMREPEKP